MPPKTEQPNRVTPCVHCYEATAVLKQIQALTYELRKLLTLTDVYESARAKIREGAEELRKDLEASPVCRRCMEGS